MLHVQFCYELLNRIGHLTVTTAKHFKLMRLTVLDSDNVEKLYLVAFVVK